MMVGLGAMDTASIAGDGLIDMMPLVFTGSDDEHTTHDVCSSHRMPI
jgi:hypothetical protein